MNIILILLGIMALGFVGLIHEMGHFIMAKKFNINVYEFSLGIGPKIISFYKNNTCYVLRLFPFFAYVKIAEKNKEINLLSIKSRFYLYIGGILFNFLTGILIFVIIGMGFGFVTNKLIIEKVFSENNLVAVELKKNDQIIAINNNALINLEHFTNIMNSNKKNIINFTIKRNNEIINFNIKTKEKNTKIKYKMGFSFKKEKLNIFSSIKYSLKLTNIICLEFFKNIFKIIIGKTSLEISGPIGIINMTTKFSKSINEYLIFIALLNISIALFNFIPIFILDGGKLLLLLIEKIRKKPFKEKTENYLINFSFILVLIILIYSTFKDIIHIFGE